MTKLGQYLSIGVTWYSYSTKTPRYRQIMNIWEIWQVLMAQRVHESAVWSRRLPGNAQCTAIDSLNGEPVIGY